MRIIIIGCGRVGSGLAQTLILRGHKVTVVDKDPTSFEKLGTVFKGNTITGVGFDRQVLLQAGIERADGLAAVTSSDEANVLAARIARQIFHVPKIVARLYDPGQADIYKRLGLRTIAPIPWGIHRIADLLLQPDLDIVDTIGSGDVSLVTAETPSLLVGRTVRELTVAGEIHVVAITRNSKTFLPIQGTVFRENDIIHLAILATSEERLNELLGHT